MTIPLREADQRCGAKAATLARLMREGFPVPAGFVVDTRDGQWPAQVGTALRDLGPGPFAVRSSARGEDGATASFAGQLRTALGVTTDRVVDEVRRVATSTSGEAAAYARRMGHPPLGPVPVLVQVMVRAEAAGVLFTRHPVTGAPQVVVEAVRGLGDGVVGGTVTPESWTVDCGTVVRSHTPDRPALSPAQVQAVAETGRRVEALLGCPQDVEWALADGVVWLLQARPVTALPGVPRPAEPPVGPVLTTGTPASPGRATGHARVVDGLDDFGRLRPGDVLVCRTTSPAWTPLLARAAAVVTETGGILAHAAIVAREFGIPAVLAAADATTTLRDGQLVVVDGTSGTVARAEDSGRTP